MHEETERVDPDDVYGLVVEALTQFEEPSEARADGVWLTKWPSVRISLDYGTAWRPAPDNEAWSAWVDLTCMYNVNLAFTAAPTHVVGIGKGRSEAIADAVESWKKAVVPVLISYIYGFLKGEADTWSEGDARSIAGWSCIAGPYLLRGDAGGVETLGVFLQAQALVLPVRERLVAMLDGSAPFHTVALYRAQTASGVFADVLIDNQPDTAAGEMLKRMDWPAELGGSQFVSARQFLLCAASTGKAAP
jgi:hypothetical protein